MKVGIDSYCYHRFFGEVYPHQNPPDKQMTLEGFIKRAKELGVDGVSLESCFIPQFDTAYLSEIKGMLDEFNFDRVYAWGHPDGLEGEAIPIGARLLALTDSLNAMLQGRPYRAQRSFNEAAAEIENMAGSQFCPRLAEPFLTEAREREGRIKNLQRQDEQDDKSAGRPSTPVPTESAPTSTGVISS